MIHPVLRIDLRHIADMVEPDSRVLDVGCGDGALLAWLNEHKQIDGRGIELSMAGVRSAVAQGLSVIQGDADTDLTAYPAQAFDCVILSQTLQATRNPRVVLEHLLRIGKRAIVSFPNFGYWRVRLHLLLRGRMPVTKNLAWQWYDTPNIHLCTIRDFMDLCASAGIEVESALALDASGNALRSLGLANLLCEQAVFRLKRKE